MIELAKLKVSEYMDGAQKAVKYNGFIHVSKALHSLIIHANHEELQVLLSQIGVLDMDEKEATLIITDKKKQDWDMPLS